MGKQNPSWWEDEPDEQREFWSEDGTVVSLSENTAEKQQIARAGERVPKADACGENGNAELKDDWIEKGKVMSMLAIAKFLKINGSVYDGSDRGRWLAVPSAKAALPYQLMKAPKQPGGFFRSFRSLPRDFSGINTYRLDSYAGK